MTDMEKVIKAIECCVVNHTRCFDDNDKLCPYFSTKVYMCEIELLKDALDLLKEQEDMGKELTDAIELIHKKNERIKKLEEQIETLTRWRMNAGAFD